MSDPFPKEIVRERLRSIRLLRGVSAGYSLLCSGEYRYGGAIAGFSSNVFVSICGFPSLTNKESAIPCRKNDIVSHFFCFHYLMEKKRGTKTKPPRQRYSPPLSKLYPAISPRRRLDLEFGKPNSGAARERSSNAKDGTILVSKRTCTNEIHIHPLIKVLRSFFKSDRSPRSPRPTIAGSDCQRSQRDGRSRGWIGGRRRRGCPGRRGGGADRGRRRLHRRRGARTHARRGGHP